MISFLKYISTELPCNVFSILKMNKNYTIIYNFLVLFKEILLYM